MYANKQGSFDMLNVVQYNAWERDHNITQLPDHYLQLHRLSYNMEPEPKGDLVSCV